MSDIQFNEEQYGSSRNVDFQEQNSKFVQLLINWGLATDAKSANIILISLSIIFFGTSIYFFLKVMGFM